MNIFRKINNSRLAIHFNMAAEEATQKKKDKRLAQRWANQLNVLSNQLNDRLFAPVKDEQKIETILGRIEPLVANAILKCFPGVAVAVAKPMDVFDRWSVNGGDQYVVTYFCIFPVVKLYMPVALFVTNQGAIFFPVEKWAKNEAPSQLLNVIGAYGESPQQTAHAGVKSSLSKSAPNPGG